MYVSRHDVNVNMNLSIRLQFMFLDTMMFHEAAIVTSRYYFFSKYDYFGGNTAILYSRITVGYVHNKICVLKTM